MTIDEARRLMRDMQTASISAYAVTNDQYKVGDFEVEILRPVNASELLPMVLYLHGGGWVHMHIRLMREIMEQTKAAVVFVESGRTVHS